MLKTLVPKGPSTTATTPGNWASLRDWSKERRGESAGLLVGQTPDSCLSGVWGHPRALPWEVIEFHAWSSRPETEI